MTYWPLTGFIEYQVAAITGRWHDSGHLDVLTSVPIPPEQHGYQRETYIDTGSMVAKVTGDIGVAQTKPVAGRTLYEGYGGDGWGETLNNLDMIQMPPILLLPENHTVGRVINAVSKIFAPTADHTWEAFYFPSRNIVLGVGPWGPWPDCVRTALWENPENQNTSVYNYVFAKDIGLVNYWYGVKDAAGNVAGYQYYMIGRG